MDKKVLVLILAVLAVVAVAAIAFSGGSEDKKETKEVPCTGIVLDKTALSVEAGASGSLKASASPSGCTDAITWSTSDASVCTVSGGLVKGVSPGAATVTAKCGAYEASCSVTVPKPVEEKHTASISLDRTTLEVESGTTVALVATVAPSDTVDREEWTTSDRFVATVSQGGYVTGRDPGNATITVTSGGCSATCEVTVVPGPTAGEKNALEEAKAYLRFSAYSKEGLKDQLMYEKFTEAEAEYAVSHVAADWKEQALRSAKGYLDYSAFSYAELVRQLEYEKFTAEESRYGADQCGADWYEQAVRSAREYLAISSFSISSSSMWLSC